MKKWEYLIKPVRYVPDAHEMDTYGKLGWEFVQLIIYKGSRDPDYIFKRELTIDEERRQNSSPDAQRGD